MLQRVTNSADPRGQKQTMKRWSESGLPRRYSDCKTKEVWLTKCKPLFFNYLIVGIGVVAGLPRYAARYEYCTGELYGIFLLTLCSSLLFTLHAEAHSLLIFWYHWRFIISLTFWPIKVLGHYSQLELFWASTIPFKSVYTLIHAYQHMHITELKVIK